MLSIRADINDSLISSYLFEHSDKLLIDELKNFNRCVGITLGAGPGSAFTDCGGPLIHGKGVREGGFFYNKRFNGVLASRLISALILSRINNLRFFTVTSFSTILFLTLTTVPPSVELPIIFIALIRLGSGNLFPLIFSFTLNKLPEKSNEISVLMIMAVVGDALIRPLMDYVQEFRQCTSSRNPGDICRPHVF